MKVIIVDYDPNWKVLFEQESQLIKDLVGDNNLVNIIHIGSTSVPNLRAKPIIDILLIVNDLDQLDSLNDRFVTLDYEPMGEFGLPGRRYFRKGGDNRTHQIHAYHYTSISEIHRHITFKDYLICHPNIANEYGNLKQQLSLSYPQDISSYCDGKDPFIKHHEALALKWYWKSK